MPVKKTCAHARGLVGEARMRAWTRCPCSWYADLYVDGHRQVVNAGKDRLAAKALYHRLLADALAGRAHTAQPGAVTFGAACDRWIDRAEAEGARPATLAAYRSRLVRLHAYFGADAPLTAIEPADIEQFVVDTRKVRSAGYTRDLYTTLLAVLRLAEADGLIERAPLPARPMRLRRETREQLTIAQVERLIPLVAEPYRELAELSLLTGLRIGEMLGLEAADLEGRQLRVARTMGKDGKIGPPKTDSSRRRVTLSGRAHEIVSAAVARHPEGRIFPYSFFVAQERLRTAMETAGLYERGRAWHSFRHASATLRDQVGHSLRGTSAEMGHGSNLSQTMRYGSAAAVDADALDRARQGPSAA